MWFIKKRKWNKKEVPFIGDLQDITNIYLENIDTELKRRLSDDERNTFMSFFSKGSYREMYKCASSFEVSVEYKYGTATYYVHHNALGPNPGGMIQNIFSPSEKGFKTFLDNLEGFKYFSMDIRSLNECYHDKDEILLHTSFQVLVNFVEQEKPEEMIDWETNKEDANNLKEIKALYHWWTELRVKRQDPLDNPNIKHPPLVFEKSETDFSHLKPYDKQEYSDFTQAMKEHHQYNDTCLEEDQKNLKRLIDIRMSLWT